MELLDRVAAAIAARRLLAAGDTAVVAVSGGADSMTLLDLLARLRPLHRWHLHVATFDHRWGAHGAAAVEAVRSVAAAWGLPFHTATAAVVTTDEDSARRQRWQFLDSVALSVGAATVAVGHTAEDRAETLLLNLLRGSGTTGLGAMGSRRGVIRPLLDLSRAEVRAYAAEARLVVQDDPTNADPRWLRNRLRADVLPRLEALRPGAAAASYAYHGPGCGSIALA